MRGARHAHRRAGVQEGRTEQWHCVGGGAAYTQCVRRALDTVVVYVLYETLSALFGVQVAGRRRQLWPSAKLSAPPLSQRNGFEVFADTVFLHGRGTLGFGCEAADITCACMMQAHVHGHGDPACDRARQH